MDTFPCNPFLNLCEVKKFFFAVCLGDKKVRRRTDELKKSTDLYWLDWYMNFDELSLPRKNR